jgi:hypothetical protein
LIPVNHKLLEPLVESLTLLETLETQTLPSLALMETR